MPRPITKRCICFLPQITYYKPAGVPRKSLKEISLAFDELEAIRLKDLEKLDQEDVAKMMKVSRPTVVRILKSARSKIAQALVQGYAIKIQKGQNIILQKKLKTYCYDKRCGRTFMKKTIRKDKLCQN